MNKNIHTSTYRYNMILRIMRLCTEYREFSLECYNVQLFMKNNLNH